MLSERIKAAREKAGLKKSEVARILEMPYTTYDSYERGKSEPSVTTLQKIADTLGVDVNYLLNGQTLEERNAAYLESKNARWMDTKRWANGKERVVAACNVLNENGTQLLADIAEAMTEENTLRQLDKQPIKKETDKK